MDQHHRDDLIELLDTLPLREEHHVIMGVSALHTIQMVIQANHELVERADDLSRSRSPEAAAPRPLFFA
jgi:hypothetical protein